MHYLVIVGAKIAAMHIGHAVFTHLAGAGAAKAGALSLQAPLATQGHQLAAAGVHTALVKSASAAGGKAAAASIGATHGAAAAPATASLHQALVSHGALNAIQVHNGLLTMGVAADAAASATIAGVSLAELERAFVKGFAVKTIRLETVDRIDKREVRRWFVEHATEGAERLAFTATGHMSKGRFVPAPVGKPSTTTVLQGVLTSDGKRVGRGRMFRLRAGMSQSLQKAHAESGMVVYGTI